MTHTAPCFRSNWASSHVQQHVVTVTQDGGWGCGRSNLTTERVFRRENELLLETVCRLKESLLLGVMGGGPGEEVELEEDEGGPGDTERRRSPPIWRTWLLGLWGLRGLIWVMSKQRKEVDDIRGRVITERSK